ncbi:MAG: cellulose biosynthesis cyclic di-GMP-binding regulatory protein BcsB [Ignavibacteria bacterium]
MRTFRWFMLLGALLGLSAQAETIRIPLSKLSPYGSIDLRCTNGGHSVSIPIPERWEVRRAVLGLRFTASTNLIADMSQLIIRMNDQPIAQTRLNPMAPNVELAVNIPVSLLKPDYNTLGFQVSQHFARGKCEDTCAPDLWTNINLNESQLTLEYSLKPLPLKLGAVANLLFDPKIYPEAAVHVVVEKVTEETATLAGIVSSGIARRFDYRKASFSIGSQLKPDVDNVVIGTPAFVNGLLGGGAGPVRNVDGGILKIVHGRDAKGEPDRTHVVIAVAGKNANAQKIAAETLANISLPYPGSDELVAFGFKLPEIAMYGGRQILSSDKVFDLKTLNFPTYSWIGFNAPANGISFRLPADFMIKQNQFAKLSLNFSYGAGLRKDSALNVLVNDKPLRAIALDQSTGSYAENYLVDIPTYVFKPGANTITFAPVLNTPREICDAGQSDGSFLTLYGNSTLYFPPMPHYVEMPKLELFALNGFPITRWPDGYETLVYVPKGNRAALEAALNLMGSITQKNGFPLLGVQIVFDEPKDWAGELIVVGQTPDLPDKLFGGAPMKVLKEGSVPYPVIRSWDTELTVAKSRQVSDAGSGTGALMQFESPYRIGRSIVLLTAGTESDVAAMGQAILDGTVQGAAQGDLMLVDLTKAPDYKVTSMRVGDRYSTGNRGEITRVEAYLYEHPRVFYGILFGSILALAAVAFVGLRNYRRGRARSKEQLPAPK